MHSLSQLVTVPHSMGACGRSHLCCKWPKEICWIVDLVGRTSERYLIIFILFFISIFFRLRGTFLISLSTRTWSLFLYVVTQLLIYYPDHYCCRRVPTNVRNIDCKLYQSQESSESRFERLSTGAHINIDGYMVSWLPNVTDSWLVSVHCVFTDISTKTSFLSFFFFFESQLITQNK